MRLPTQNTERKFVYHPPTFEEISNYLTMFESYHKLFTEKTGLVSDYYAFFIIEICIRIHQRSEYYQYFHSDENETTLMSETKETALMCFWVLKYKPLYQNKDTMKDYFGKECCTVNEKFVTFVMKTYVTSLLYNRKAEINRFFDENDFTIKYNLMHRDISKESLIMFLNSLIETLKS